MNQKMEIIYEDQDLAVCRKPPGIPVQTAKLAQLDMVSLLRNYFMEKGEENLQVFVVHRLDQPVEGIMVFARNQRAAAELSRQSRERNMDKTYLALTEGRFAESSGVLEDYLWHDRKTNSSRVVKQGTPGAKQARLIYEVEDVYDIWDYGANSQHGRQAQEPSDSNQPGSAVSLVRVHLVTGRHHQIRVQMAHAGHPLVGDRKYNPGSHGDVPIGLCAVNITFVHPVTGKAVEFAVEPQGQAFQSINFGL